MNKVADLLVSPASKNAEPLDELLGRRTLSISLLKEKIAKKMMSPSRLMCQSDAVPRVVAAAFEVLMDFQSIQFPTGSNALTKASQRNSKGYQCLKRYQELFPPGTIGFTFPRDDKSAKPDLFYSQLEGRTIYFARWELNIPGIYLGCVEQGCEGEMIHQRYDYQTHGFLTPITTYESLTMLAVCSTAATNAGQNARLQMDDY